MGLQASPLRQPVGPYSGWLGENIASDDSFFFCLTFLKTANWGASYSGVTMMPSTPQQLQAAWLGALLAGLGGQNATLAEKGAISMAVWQVMDAAPGDVPRDPAAQAYVTGALNAYASGGLNPADFPNTVIFVPDDSSIQSFMMLAASAPGVITGESQTSPVPEPDTPMLVVAGVGLIWLGRHRAAKRLSER